MTNKQAQDLLAAAAHALADLQGIMPDYEPSGDRLHPGWKTIEELEQAIENAEKGVKDEASCRDIVEYLAKKGSDDIVEFLTKKGG